MIEVELQRAAVVSVGFRGGPSRIGMWTIVRALAPFVFLAGVYAGMWFRATTGG